MFALELYRVQCPKCKSENIFRIDPMGEAVVSRYQCDKCQKKFFRFAHSAFFMINVLVVFFIFCKVYDAYAVEWLQNYMLLSWWGIGVIANGLWIKNNFPTIKTRWKNNRYYVAKLSILSFCLFNAMLPAALHLINEHFGELNNTTVYGKLVDVRMRKKEKSSKPYPEGTFQIDEKGYKGFLFKSVAGYTDIPSLLMKVVVKKGFFGWEWLDEKSIIGQ